MFDDCNTFFKGKPDGRDESWTGVPRAGANPTPGARRAVLQRARCAILTLRVFRLLAGLRQATHVPKFRGGRPRTIFWANGHHRNRLGTARRPLRPTTGSTPLAWKANGRPSLPRWVTGAKYRASGRRPLAKLCSANYIL